MKINIRIIKVAGVVVLLCVAIFLAWQVVAPGGTAIYKQDFQSDNFKRLGQLKPQERTEPRSATGQTIVGAPIYFTLNTFRPWHEAHVKIKYRTSPTFNHSVIEMGMLTNQTQWQYLLKPLENSTLDKIMNSWSVVASGSEKLLQRKQTFSTIAEFKQNPPKFNEIATYNNNLEYHKVYEAMPGGQNHLGDPLVGGYQFFTVVNDGTLSIKFGFTEAKNLDVAKSKTEIFVYEGRNLIRIIDLSVKRDEIVNFGWWVHAFEEKNLKPGYYKIEVRSDDNLVTRSIELNQQAMSFVGRLHFAFDVKVPVKLWTNSRKVSFVARDAQSLGQVLINNEPQQIYEAFEQYNYDTNKKFNEIKLTTSGLEIAGDGVFAFEQTGVFDPRIKQVDHLADLDKDEISYILTDYTAPTKAGEWTVATATFDYRRAVKDTDGYKFMLSIPGFRADDQVNDWLEIASIELEMTGETPLQYLRRKLREIARRLIVS